LKNEYLFLCRQAHMIEQIKSGMAGGATILTEQD
jgi:hypothetical protein